MHKGVILLTKAGNEDEAKAKATTFVEQYQDRVWDWYELGGRCETVLGGNNVQHELLADSEKKERIARPAPLWRTCHRA